MREKGKGTTEMEERYLPQRDKGLLLDREETDVAHRQMAVYKGTRGNPYDGMFNFDWAYELGEPKRAFDCWTSVL